MLSMTFGGGAGGPRSRGHSANPPAPRFGFCETRPCTVRARPMCARVASRPARLVHDGAVPQSYHASRPGLVARNRHQILSEYLVPFMHTTRNERPQKISRESCGVTTTLYDTRCLHGTMYCWKCDIRSCMLHAGAEKYRKAVLASTVKRSYLSGLSSKRKHAFCFLLRSTVQSRSCLS